MTKTQLKQIIKEEVELDEMARVADRPSDVAAASVGALIGLLGGPASPVTVIAGGVTAKALFRTIFKDLLRTAAPKYSDETGEEDMLKALLAARVAYEKVKDTPEAQEEGVKWKGVAPVLDKVWVDLEPQERKRVKFDLQALEAAKRKLREEHQEYPEIVDEVYNEIKTYIQTHMGVDTALGAATVRATRAATQHFKEVKLRRGSAKIGGAIGLGIGTLLGFGVSSAATGPAGAALGLAGGAIYDKYLLSKMATEDDLVHIGNLKKEESIKNEVPWDVNSWLAETIGKLSPKQRKNIIYEEAELLKAGREQNEEELASQIIDYFAQEGMLDDEGAPQLPGMEVPQIDVDDEVPPEETRMVAESKRMLVIAGLIKG